MTDKVEQVARALDGWDYAPCADGNPDCPGGLSCPKNINKAAIAAIKAMREPSHEMLRVGSWAWTELTADCVGDIFPAMIDAALGDKK